MPDKVLPIIIYCAINIFNNKKYIGKTRVSLKKRKQNHYNNYTNKKVNKTAFYHALNKYGWDNFIWTIIDTAETIDELNKKEISWIQKANSLCEGNGGYGYNMTTGGDGGYIHTEESLRKNSESKKGKKLTEEHKKKISESQKGKKNHFYGKKHSKKTKETLSKKNKGRRLREETKDNISKGFNIPTFSVYDKNTLEYIGTWNNYTKCSKDINGNIGHIRSCVVGRKKSYKNFIFIKGVSYAR